MIAKLEWTQSNIQQSKQGCKDQESIQSSTRPDPGYQWESDKLIVNQRQTQNPHKQWEVHLTIDQQQQNHRLRVDSSLMG